MPAAQLLPVSRVSTVSALGRALAADAGGGAIPAFGLGLWGLLVIAVARGGPGRHATGRRSRPAGGGRVGLFVIVRIIIVVAALAVIAPIAIARAIVPAGLLRDET